MSADGSVVVGFSDDGWPGGGTFIWQDTTGMLSLRSVLMDAGVTNLNGWLLRGDALISADGLTVVGTGINPSGKYQPWKATLDPKSAKPVPESSLVFSVLGVALGMLRQRKV